MLRYVALLLLCAHFTNATAHVHKFGDENEMKDEGHIKQHLENKIEVEKMTPDQQQFHYFSMHDLDKNMMIDGIEILKALTHDHEDDTGPGRAVDDEENMVHMIDAVLKDLDIDGDGYIDFAEYMKKRGD